MQLEAQRISTHLIKHQSSSSADDRSSDTGFLQVPQPMHAQRSHSFDSAAASAGSDDSGTFLEVPRRVKTRRSSSTKTPPPCVHCMYLEEYQKRLTAEQRYFVDHREVTSHSYSYTSSEEDQSEVDYDIVNEEGEEGEEDEEEEEEEDDDDDDNDNENQSGNEAVSVGGGENSGASRADDTLIIDEYDDAAIEMDIRLGGCNYGSSIEESRTRLPRQMRRHTIGSSVTTSEDEGVEESYTEHDSPHFGNTLLPPAPTTPCGITFTLSPTLGDDCTAATFPYTFPIDPGSPPAAIITPQLSLCSSPIFELPPPPPSVSPYDILPESPCFDLPLPPPPAFSTPSVDSQSADADGVGYSSRARRRSISRQEAIFVEPTGNSLENVSHEEEDPKSSVDTVDSVEEASTMATCGSPTAAKHALVVRDIYLTVPDIRRDRAASVDSCFSKVSSGSKTEELQPSADGCFLVVPNINSTRSRSVDIVLPTDEQARYKALAMTNAATGGHGVYADGYVFSLFVLRTFLLLIFFFLFGT